NYESQQPGSGRRSQEALDVSDSTCLAGITVTDSRGFSPHSAAGRIRANHLASQIYLLHLLYHIGCGFTREEIALFDPISILFLYRRYALRTITMPRANPASSFFLKVEGAELIWAVPDTG
ncbi:MAG: hypothetical protein ACI4P4_17915, partial [Faecousia sp.]